MINFDLKNTLFCGQSFCWRVEGTNYVSVLNKKVYRINENSDINDPYLKNYLDMNFDYPLALSQIKIMDEKFVDIIDKCNEIHILNQDLWETIIGFILSQNNNIKRIEGLYDTLCRTYGTEIEKGYYSFPRPENMKNATESELRDLRVGFRAPYILDAIQKSDILLELDKEVDDDKCDTVLQSVKGIGPKVSACVRLFSLHNLDAFPKDVWIKKVMKNEFSDKSEADFSPLAGLAQQYMFHYARLGYFKNL